MRLRRDTWRVRQPMTDIDALSHLLRDQRSELLPVAAALERQLQGVTGLERTVLLWRRESMAGTMRFLQLMVASAHEQPGSLARIPVPRPEGLPWSE